MNTLLTEEVEELPEEEEAATDEEGEEKEEDFRMNEPTDGGVEERRLSRVERAEPNSTKKTTSWLPVDETQDEKKPRGLIRSSAWGT